jgi:ferredoxin-NADP reductase
MAFDVLVKSITYEAPGIHSFELVPLHGDLPAFTAGAHIDVFLADGLTRQYSLHNRPGERHRYVIAILRLPAGRGGSEAMHRLRVGEVLTISAPRNHFEMAERARHTVLVAGGIGITPLLAMSERLEQLESSYVLHYCCRERSKAAFVDRLAGREASGKVRIHCDEGNPARGLDVASLFKEVPDQTQVYCCGPAGLMVAVRSATGHWPPGTVNFESFAAAPSPPVIGGEESGEIEFEMELASSKRVIGVRRDQSMLEALRAAGMDIDSSCEAGTCGTCRTRYLAGIPDHRDFVLGTEELKEYLMPCISRCKTERIVLDL